MQEERPSWIAFGTVCFLCLVPCALLLALAWFFSGMAHWSDGSGVYERHVILESLPLLSLGALPLAYLPFFRRRVAGGFIGLSFALYAAYLVYLFPKIGLGGAVASLLVGGLVIWLFWANRMAIGRTEPIQPPQTTTRSSAPDRV